MIDIPTEQTTAATDLLLAVIALGCICAVLRQHTAQSDHRQQQISPHSGALGGDRRHWISGPVLECSHSCEG
jgi:hypothetical protein